MSSQRAARRDVFRTIAHSSHSEWPIYDTTPLYDRGSLDGLLVDVRTVAAVWFDHDAHDSIEEFVCHYPLAYVEFESVNRYSGSTRYGISQLLRVFLIKKLHGWEHETALVEYLRQHPSLRQQLGFESIPDQSTLWRSWRKRFTPALRETIETLAEAILVKADQAGVAVPREPPSIWPRTEADQESTTDEQAVLDLADAITDQLSHIVYPAFSLNRDPHCEIHENAFWDLQTYLGLP